MCFKKIFGLIFFNHIPQNSEVSKVTRISIFYAPTLTAYPSRHTYLGNINAPIFLANTKQLKKNEHFQL